MMDGGLRYFAAGFAVLWNDRGVVLPEEILSRLVLWNDRGPILPEEVLSRLVPWNDRVPMLPEEMLSRLSGQLRATRSSHAG